MMIGLDRVAGYFGSAVVEEWGAGHALESVPQMTPAALEEQLQKGDVMVLDVRGRQEWDAGHLPGATHIPLGYLRRRVTEVPRDRTVVVQCQGGGRSAIAASLLRALGFANIANLAGGIAAWRGEVVFG